ncbi:MAG: hypothetical protein ACLFUO_01095 [Candidatus Woesearchaeota archaeon]
MNKDDVAPDKYFYIHDGRSIKNISELASMLSSMDDAVFSFHVNESKNDFASWVRFVVDSPQLADSMDNVKDKDKMASLILKSISGEDGEKVSEISGKSQENNKEDEVLEKSAGETKTVREKKVQKSHDSDLFSFSSSNKHEEKKNKSGKIKTGDLKKENNGSSKLPPVKEKKHHDEKSPPKNKSSAKSSVLSNKYEDDFDWKNMLDDMKLGEQEDMLSRISRRIKEMNSEISGEGKKISSDKEFEKNKKESSEEMEKYVKSDDSERFESLADDSVDFLEELSKRLESHRKRFSESDKKQEDIHEFHPAKKIIKKVVKEDADPELIIEKGLDLEKTNKLLSKYNSIMNDTVKKSMKRTSMHTSGDDDSSKEKREKHVSHKTYHHNRSQDKKHKTGENNIGYFSIIERTDDLEGISSKFESDDDGDSGQTFDDGSAHEKTDEKQKKEKSSKNKVSKGNSRGFFSIFKKLKMGSLNSVGAMEHEKKAQENITVIRDPLVEISGISDFIKGLLIGMIIGMVFLLVF